MDNEATVPTSNTPATEVNVSNYFSKEANQFVTEAIAWAHKRKLRTLTPHSMALKVLYDYFKHSIDKTQTILDAIDKIEDTPEVEDVALQTDRYLFLSPGTQLVLINAFVSAQSQGRTDVVIKDIVQSLCENTTDSEIARILTNAIATIENTQLHKVALTDLEAEIQHHIIGQKTAIKVLVAALKRSTTILKDAHKPIGSFLFLGPTGVGKTELAKTLASLYFDSGSFVRLDMSEYSEPHSTQKLIGAPPGYIGYEEGGQLTGQVMLHPEAIILFDEIEKANIKVFDLMLQLIDEGRLTDGHGQLVDFTHTILIFTSNTGADTILQQAGDTSSLLSTDPDKFYQKEILPQLLNTFRPEFINRFENIVMFQPLLEDQIMEIAKLKIAKIVESLAENRINLTVTPETVAKVVSTGYDPRFGARPLERAIQTLIVDPISEKLVNNQLHSGSTCEI